MASVAARTRVAIRRIRYGSRYIAAQRRTAFTRRAAREIELKSAATAARAVRVARRVALSLKGEECARVECDAATPRANQSPPLRTAT
jgi:hypothetical protein